MNHDDDVIDARFVELAFEDASRTLAALRWSGHSPGLAQSVREIVREPGDEESGFSGALTRCSGVEAHKITAMDEVFTWLTFIPDRQRLLRRIIAARSITHYVTGKPTPWRKIGDALRAHPQAVKNWHGQALALIAAELNRRLPQPAPPISCAIHPAPGISHAPPPAAPAI